MSYMRELPECQFVYLPQQQATTSFWYVVYVTRIEHQEVE